MRYLIIVCCLLAMAGCISTRHHERGLQEQYATGYNLGQNHAEATCNNRAQGHYERGLRDCARAGYTEPMDWSLDRRMSQKSLEEAIRVSANPETPETVRDVLNREITQLRTQIQDKALDAPSGTNPAQGRFEEAGKKVAEQMNRERPVPISDEEFRRMLDDADAKTWREFCPKLKRLGLIMEASPCP